MPDSISSAYDPGPDGLVRPWSSWTPCRIQADAAWPRRFRHHFSHTWLDRGGPEADLTGN